MNKKIGVIGEKDAVLPFQLFGFEVVYATSKKQVKKEVEKMAVDFGVVLITEFWAREIPETIERFQKELLPAIILLPNHHGSLGIGLEKIQKTVERAVGQNIL